MINITFYPQEKLFRLRRGLLSKGRRLNLVCVRRKVLSKDCILTREMVITLQEIDRVLLAGAFGNYIRKESAVGIGLLPSIPLEQIMTIGNAAGDGAKMALISTKGRSRADLLSRRAEHVELSNKKEFQREFIKGLDFKRAE